MPRHVLIVEDEQNIRDILAELFDVDDTNTTTAATLDQALAGGEDYELLATVAPAAVVSLTADLMERFGTRLSVIGQIAPGDGITIEDAAGRRTLDPAGWDHFA